MRASSTPTACFDLSSFKFQNAILLFIYLPDADDGIGDEDEQDDEGLHERRDGLIVVLEEGQNLK